MLNNFLWSVHSKSKLYTSILTSCLFFTVVVTKHGLVFFFNFYHSNHAYRSNRTGDGNYHRKVAWKFIKKQSSESFEWWLFLLWFFFLVSLWYSCYLSRTQPEIWQGRDKYCCHCNVSIATRKAVTFLGKVLFFYFFDNNKIKKLL